MRCIEQANSTEFGATTEPLVGLMTEWMRGNELEKRHAAGDLGGTMRLGAYQAQLAGNSHVATIYGASEISERHRHRYEVNPEYVPQLEQRGFRVTGLSPEIAQTLVTIGVDLGTMNTVGDLQGGIEQAEKLLGYKVAPSGESR